MTVTTDTHFDDLRQHQLEETCRRAESLEAAGVRRQSQLAEAEAIADPESHEIRADGSGETDGADEEELPELRIGDTVTDRDTLEETKMLVTGLPLEAADELTANGKTIAEHIVESHTQIDDRLGKIEERLDRAERDIDIIDGGY